MIRGGAREAPARWRYPAPSRGSRASAVAARAGRDGWASRLGPPRIRREAVAGRGPVNAALPRNTASLVGRDLTPDSRRGGARPARFVAICRDPGATLVALRLPRPALWPLASAQNGR